MSVLEGPGVDRVAVANEPEHARVGQLLGGPLVQALQARHDDGVVEHPAQTLLLRDIALDVEVERIAVREHAPEREEHSSHPEPRVADQAADRSQPSQRQPWRRIQRVRVQRRAASATFMKKRSGELSGFGELPVLQVGAHDARVVRAVPVAPRRPSR